MLKKILLISEIINYPFDEGAKGIVYHLIKELNKRGDVHIFTKKGNNTNGLNVGKINLDKLFLNNELKLIFKSLSPEIILYIPEASYTFNSFIRAKILKLLSKRSKVFILGVQRRRFNCLSKMFLMLLKPECLLLFSRADKDYFKQVGFKVKVLPPAIDKEKFYEVEHNTRIMLRKRYNLPIDKIIVTHIGHIKESRNLTCFVNIQRIDNIQVVIVGSTSTHTDLKLKQFLEDQGIIVINNYLQEIQEIYQLSDVYVFPVLEETGAIEMPLSVLEAMACNLPVITTRFGCLVEHFKEDAGVKYFNDTEELVGLVRNVNKNEVYNYEKVEHFSWERFTDAILATFEE